LFGEQTKIEQTLKINWQIDLNILKNWKYILQLELLDKNNIPLKNWESKIEIEVEKIEHQETFIEKAIRTSKNTNQTNKYNYTTPQSFITEELLENYKTNGNINKQILKNINKNLLFQIYTSNQNTNIPLWYWLTHNYESKFYYDKLAWKIELLMPNWTLEIFAEQRDFTYKPSLNTHLKLEEIPNYFKVTDMDEGKVYYFWKNEQRLEKINPLPNPPPKGEGIEQTFLFYNYNWTLKEVITNNQKYTFQYYENNNLLRQITNENNQELLKFEYQRVEDIYILKQINATLINYNQQWIITNREEIEQDLEKHFKDIEYQRQIQKFENDEKLQKKLGKIKRNIDTKFSKKQKERLRKYIEKNKSRYINKAKTGKKDFYEYILNKLEEYLSS